MKLLFSITLIILSLIGYSQQPTFNWVNGISSDDAVVINDMTIDDDGNIYTVGYFTGTVDFDPSPNVLPMYYDWGGMFIQKIDENGVLIWLKTFETTDDFANYLVGVTTNSFGHVFLTGTFELAFDMNPNAGTEIASSNGEDNLFIIKLDTAGNYIWGKSYGNADGSSGVGIAADQNDNVYITGGFNNTIDFDLSTNTDIHSCPSNYQNAFLLKLNASGDFVWANSYGNLASDYGTDVVIDNLDNIYVSGVFQDLIDADPGPDNFPLYANGFQNSIIQKFDINGNLIWAGSFESSSHCQLVDMDIDDNNNIYGTGTFRAATDFDISASQFILTPTLLPNRDCFTVKMDSSGVFKWAKMMGDDSSQYQDLCEAIAVDSKGYVYTAGRFYNEVDFDPGSGTFILNTGTYGESDIYIQKLDSLGNFVWAGILENNAINSDVYAIDIGNNDKVYFIGAIPDTTDMDPTMGGYVEVIPPTGVYLMFTLCLNGDQTTGTKSYSRENNMKFFPNPVKNILQINSDEAISEIMIYDSSGKLAKNIKTDSKTQIQVPLRGLTTGIYLISCVTSKKIVSYKIIIE